MKKKSRLTRLKLLDRMLDVHAIEWQTIDVNVYIANIIPVRKIGIAVLKYQYQEEQAGEGKREKYFVHGHAMCPDDKEKQESRDDLPPS